MIVRKTSSMDEVNQDLADLRSGELDKPKRRATE